MGDYGAPPAGGGAYGGGGRGGPPRRRGGGGNLRRDVPPGNPDAPWRHDLFDDTDVAPIRRARSAHVGGAVPGANSTL